MKKNILIGSATAILFLFACLTGCEEKQENLVTALTIKEAEYISSGTYMRIALKDNATLQLTPFIMPRDAANQTVTYSNMYPNLMEVSASGFITAKAIGTDTLTVSATDGSGIKVSYRVEITDHMIKATAINVTAEGNNMILKLDGASFDLAAQVTLAPDDTWDKTVTYQSNDEDVATVTEDGIVSPVGVGNTTITIRTADGSNLSRNCNVTVQDRVQRWEDFDRTNWTITTQTATGYEYAVDGTTGLPEHMFDNNPATYLSLVKPGKSFNPIPAQSADFLPSFTVDMRSEQEFNYILWRHRSTNNYQYLRIYGVNVYGSNDESNFTRINTEEDGIVWIPNINGYVGGNATSDPNIYRIDIPLSTYRYIKIEYAMWSDRYASQHPDYPGNGSTSGSTVQVSEFGVGYSYWE